MSVSPVGQSLSRSGRVRLEAALASRARSDVDRARKLLDAEELTR